MYVTNDCVNYSKFQHLCVVATYIHTYIVYMILCALAIEIYKLADLASVKV